MRIVLGIFIVAAVATSGDFIWYSYGVRHTLVTGLVHGALLLTAVGGVLGAASGRIVRGLSIGALAGLGGAASYYVLIAVTGGRTYGSSIPAAWIVMWFLLAALEGRWLRAPHRDAWAAIARRGATAAIVAGVAFYLVLNVLWGRPPAGGRNYALQFLAWAFAWAPGLFALTAGRRPVSSSPSSAASAGAPTTPGDGDEGSITGAKLLERITSGEALHVLDVRSEREFAASHVPGAVNIPFTQVLSRLSDVPGTAGDELILYCGHGPRAYMAAAALRHGGWKRIVYLGGHWAAWQDGGFRVERSA